MKSLAAAALALGACGGGTTTPPDAASPWTAKQMPRPALEPGVTALGTGLVVLGGFDTGLEAGLHITDRVDVYDTLADAWTQLPTAPVPWTHIDLAAAGGSLYLLGGTSGQEFTAEGASFRLDPGASTWTSIAAIPPGFERGAAGVVVSPPHIYLLGGASTTSALATCLDYNLMTDAWTMLPDLPFPRSHPAAMRRADGTLIVAGGLASLASTLAQVDVFVLPLGATAWQTAMPMPTARGGCAYGVVAGSLVCAGGESDQGALTVVEGYEPVTDTWTALPALPMPRAGTQGASIGQQLYVPGGAVELKFEPTDTLFVYQPD